MIRLKILCSISTKNRYENFLPMAIMSVALQTRKPDHLTIYDDNDSPQDLRSSEVYVRLFQLLNAKGIPWDVVFGQKKGQHYNHQMANTTAGYDAVWRLDDDCVAEPDVLEKLERQMIGGSPLIAVGAVGGSILTPPVSRTMSQASSMIDDLDKPNKQWHELLQTEQVDHLHCSFLYRAGVVNYDLRLSNKAHREETMFTYAMKLRGYAIFVTPCITWHLRPQQGGIRSDNNEQDYHHDEFLFRKWLEFKKTGKKLYVLNGGLGDNYMFLQAVPLHSDAVVATCYPDIFKGMNVETISIADAHQIADIKDYDVYAWAAKNGWTGHLIEAYKRMYENL